MIKLQVEPIDVAKISILLAKHFVSAKVTEREIVLNDEPSVEMLSNLCDAVKILSFESVKEDGEFFENEAILPLEEVLQSEAVEEVSVISEKEISSNDTNFLTEEINHHLQSETIFDGIASKIDDKNEVPELDFTKINASTGVLELLEYCRTPFEKNKGKKKNKQITNVAYEHSKKERNEHVSAEIAAVRHNILSFVDEESFKKLASKKGSVRTKIISILELFGFDMNRNGVEYLKEAIYFSLKKEYYNVSTLSKIVAERKGLDENEVQRLIVARVKERFGFKKAPTLEFIRVVNDYINNKEN